MNTRLFDAFSNYLPAQNTGPHELVRATMPVITISRETGSGAVTIAELLAKKMEAAGFNQTPWAIFDSNLAKTVLEEHQLSPELDKYMPEDAKLPVTDTVEELLGLHPSQWTLVQYTTQTILRLASLGNVICVGRASNIITARIAKAFHVRLVAPFGRRAKHIEGVRQLSAREAEEHVRREDHARRRYVRRYFNAEVDDALLYHLVLNTGRLTFVEAAEAIAGAATEFHRRIISSRADTPAETLA